MYEYMYNACSYCDGRRTTRRAVELGTRVHCRQFYTLYHCALAQRRVYAIAKFRDRRRASSSHTSDGGTTRGRPSAFVDKAEKARVQAEAAMELAAAATERRTTLTAEVDLCKLRELDPLYVADFVSDKLVFAPPTAPPLDRKLHSRW